MDLSGGGVADCLRRLDPDADPHESLEAGLWCEPAMSVGRTPVVTLRMKFGADVRTVALKLEAANPCGSVKDRVALALLARWCPRSAGETLVTSTSGNLGVALAAYGGARGFGVVGVVDATASPEMVARMRFAGARVERVDALAVARHGSMIAARRVRAAELAVRPHHRDPDQYGSRLNPAIHAATTAPELLDAIRGRLDAVFVTTGTGGQLAGIGAHVRKARPRTRVVAVDVEGSVTFGGAPGRRILTGLGSSQRSRFLSPRPYDEVVIVSDAAGIAWCRALRASTGLALGGSSGAGLAAVWTYLLAHPEARSVALICPDGGAAYAGTIYDDDWVRGRGLDLAALAPDPGATLELMTRS